MTKIKRHPLERNKLSYLSNRQMREVLAYREHHGYGVDPFEEQYLKDEAANGITTEMTQGGNEGYKYQKNKNPVTELQKIIAKYVVKDDNNLMKSNEITEFISEKMGYNCSKVKIGIELRKSGYVSEVFPDIEKGTIRAYRIRFKKWDEELERI